MILLAACNWLAIAMVTLAGGGVMLELVRDSERAEGELVAAIAVIFAVLLLGLLNGVVG